MKKFFLYILCLSSMISVLTSCKNKPVLHVTSTDYPNMTKLYAGEFDREQANTWYLPENPYADNSCAVSIVDGALFISNAGIKQESHTCRFDGGYFVGVDLGHWDGWVKYHPYNTNVLGGTEGILVSNENCMAIVRQNNKKGYLLTGTHFPSTSDAPVGTLYVLLLCEESESWNWDQKVSFDDFPLACFVNEDQSLYVVTEQNILYVTPDLKVEMIVESDLVASIRANSIVCIGENIYCGSPMGVYQYSMNTGEELWYPANYEKLK